jgi:hypothetical protein
VIQQMLVQIHAFQGFDVALGQEYSQVWILEKRGEVLSSKSQSLPHNAGLERAVLKRTELAWRAANISKIVSPELALLD